MMTDEEYEAMLAAIRGPDEDSRVRELEGESERLRDFVTAYDNHAAVMFTDKFERHYLLHNVQVRTARKALKENDE